MSAEQREQIEALFILLSNSAWPVVQLPPRSPKSLYTKKNAIVWQVNGKRYFLYFRDHDKNQAPKG